MPVPTISLEIQQAVSDFHPTRAYHLPHPLFPCTLEPVWGFPLNPQGPWCETGVASREPGSVLSCCLDQR